MRGQERWREGERGQVGERGDGMARGQSGGGWRLDGYVEGKENLLGIRLKH